MKRIILSCMICICAVMQMHSQIHVLERCTPESQGVPSEKITALFDSLLAFPKTDIHSVMVLRHGKVIAEMYPAPFQAVYGHQLFSCSKTFTAVAVGMAIEENRLRLDDRLAAFFPEFLPDSVSAWLAGITVRDLLTMRSGFEVDTKMRTYATQWIKWYLHHPMVAEPGKQFAYDSIDTYLLAAIVQRVTGMKMMDYLRQRLFFPLGITEAYWEESPEGINTGGWGLYLQPESLAKFGLLLLNKGVWNGRRLLPEKWVAEMMARQVDVPDGDDYGYQMWMCAYPGAVRADGAYGQYIIVIPDKEMVITITQCLTGDGGKERGHIWDILMPHVSETPMAENQASKWAKRWQQYTLPLPQGKRYAATMKQIQAKNFRMEDNVLEWTSLRFEPAQHGLSLYVTDRAGKQTEIALGYQAWKTSSVAFYPPNARRSTLGSFSNVPRPFLVGGAYAWNSPHQLEIQLHYVNWMSAVNLVFDFQDDQMHVDFQVNFDSPTKIMRKKLTPLP